MKIWELRDTLNIHTSLQTYVYQATHHQCIYHLRRKAARKQLPTVFNDDWELRPRIFEMANKEDSLPLRRFSFFETHYWNLRRDQRRCFAIFHLFISRPDLLHLRVNATLLKIDLKNEIRLKMSRRLPQIE